MNCHILFSGTNMKDISKCRLLKILSIVLSVNKNRFFLQDQKKSIKRDFAATDA